MIKCYLTCVRQKSKTFYTGVCDPRILIKLVPDIGVGDSQEAQRPLVLKKIQEIARFVASKTETNLLPSSIIIATKDRTSLNVLSEKVIISDKGGNESELIRYYILLPESDVEFADYINKVDIIDGQHRLFSFKSEYRLPEFKDSDIYEIPFSLFECPTLKERQSLFMVTNEKQTSVEQNLLMWLKRELGLLNDEDDIYYSLISRMNSEVRSPLKGRIMMNGRRISKGYKANQIIKILKKIKLADYSISGASITEDQMLNLLCNYLSAWESVYSCSFSAPGTDTLTKISGLRYILLLLDTFWINATNSKQSFSVNFLTNAIMELPIAINLPPGEDVFTNESCMLAFRSEGATVKLAADHAKQLKQHFERTQKEEVFNPLEF